LSRNRGSLALVATALLVAASSTYVAFAGGAPPERPFQAATGGVGLSSAVSPAWSFHSFDPRLEAFCENETRPIPGLTCPDPGHGATVADYPPADLRP